MARGVNTYKNIVSGKDVEISDREYQSLLISSNTFEELFFGKFKNIIEDYEKETYHNLTVLYTIKYKDVLQKVCILWGPLKNSGYQGKNNKRIQVLPQVRLDKGIPYFAIGSYNTRDNVITAAILNGVYTFIDGAKDGRTYSSLWIEYPGLWGAYKEGIYEWNDNAGRDVISVNLKNVKSIHEKIINTVKRFDTKEEIRSEGNEIPYVKVSEELFRYSEDDTLPRNPAFKDITIKRANCRCELCGTENSSKDTDDNHFFEGHHLIIYSPKVQKRFKYCLDHPDNIVCLCPQCHREIHTSSEEKTKELLLKLFIKHNLLLRIFEIKNLQDIINDYIKH